MNEQEIEKGNKLIAEFMEFNKISGWNGVDLNYHKSWDWLIPIIEKIELLTDKLNGRFNVIISSNQCTIQSTKIFMSDLNTRYYSQTYSNTKIEAVYEEVIQFIKWYNKKQ